MAAFLSAIDDAEQGQVERYADALACLDLSGLSDLSPEARTSQARKLAATLNEFIDRNGIELELVPQDTEGAPYTYYSHPDGQTIQIARRMDLHLGVIGACPRSAARTSHHRRRAEDRGCRAAQTRRGYFEFH